MKKQIAVNPEEDSSGNKPVPAGDLKALVARCEALLALEGRIAKGEALLTELKADHRRMTTEEIPATMEALGVRDLALTRGLRVEVKKVIAASLPSESAVNRERDPETREQMKERYERGIKYLETAGGAAIIKTSVKADLGKDSGKLAKLVLAALKKLKVEATASRGVHPGTLSAWVRERIEAGLEVDYEALAVYDGYVAEIKRPKVSVTNKTPRT